MKKPMLAFLILLECANLFAQVSSFVPMYEKEYGTAQNSFKFSNSMLGNSPIGFATLDGRLAWVGQAREALILETRSGAVKQVIAYPGSEFGTFDANFSFGDHWAIANRGTPVVIGLDQDLHSINYSKYFDSGPKLLTGSNVYVLNNWGFMFLQNGNIICISKDKKILGPVETKTLLTQWHDQESRFDLQRWTKQQELIYTGKFLIVGGLIYPSQDVNLRQYFDEMGYVANDLPEIGANQGSGLIGMSLQGDMVLEIGSEFRVFDQKGNLLRRMLLDTFSGDDPQKERSLLFFVHPNGNIFALDAVSSENVRFFEVERKWGLDLVGMASIGSSESDISKARTSVLEMSVQELRILRNVFFALQGFDFQSWDLKSYFNGYDWYQPKPAVKADPSTLNPDQKRLFDLVVAEETRRK